MTKYTVSLTLAILAATPALTMAANTITFIGEVTDQTCNVKVNGQDNALVLLPTVSATALKTAGQTTGLTPFTISLTDCKPGPTGGLPIKTRFFSTNVITSTGVLDNTATNGASNVAVQLMKDKDGTSPVVLDGVTDVTGLVLAEGATEAFHIFAAQYYATGTATAGAVKAVTEYTVSYL